MAVSLVSIHAPAKGATPLSALTVPSALFQFTHPQRVRPRTEEERRCSREFQFTHPQRVRLRSYKCRRRACRFQFTHPQRVRPEVRKAIITRIEFQFTHPQRVRHFSGLNKEEDKKCFNSRTRKGCDYLPRHAAPVEQSFNSRTRKGCDTEVI